MGAEVKCRLRTRCGCERVVEMPWEWPQAEIVMHIRPRWRSEVFRCEGGVVERMPQDNARRFARSHPGPNEAGEYLYEED